MFFKNKNKKNRTIAWCLSKYQSERINNHLEFHEEYCKSVNGGMLCGCKPRDVFIGDGILPEGRQELDFEKELLLVGERVEISGTTHRKIVIYMPHDDKDIPEGLKNTLLGDALLIAITLRNQGLSASEIYSKGTADMNSVVEAMLTSNISDIYRNKVEEQANRMVQKQSGLSGVQQSSLDNLKSKENANV